MSGGSACGESSWILGCHGYQSFRRKTSWSSAALSPMWSKKSTGLVQQWLMPLISSVGAMPWRVRHQLHRRHCEKKWGARGWEYHVRCHHRRTNGSGGWESQMVPVATSWSSEQWWYLNYTMRKSLPLEGNMSIAAAGGEGTARLWRKERRLQGGKHMVDRACSGEWAWPWGTGNH